MLSVAGRCARHATTIRIFNHGQQLSVWNLNRRTGPTLRGITSLFPCWIPRLCEWHVNCQYYEEVDNRCHCCGGVICQDVVDRDVVWYRG